MRSTMSFRRFIHGIKARARHVRNDLQGSCASIRFYDSSVNQRPSGTALYTEQYPETRTMAAIIVHDHANGELGNANSPTPCEQGMQYPKDGKQP